MDIKKVYDYVFVILVYRNTEDLEECLRSIHKSVPCSKAVVVNAYYDEQSRTAVEEIAQHFECDFLNIENRGYSYGNNRGIAFAVEHYDFRYLIVSNPDITIEHFPRDSHILTGDIIAPRIIARRGREQNPILVCDCKVADWLLYYGCKKSIKLFLLAGFGINKAIRMLFLLVKGLSRKEVYPIYGAHGSFVVFSQGALRAMSDRPYDENMFLFAEEFVIAAKAKKKKLKTVYMPRIVIHHKEDGSMEIGRVAVNAELAKSNMYFYENYRIKR